MKLPIIKHLSQFIEENDQDYLVETIEVLEALTEVSSLKDEELDVIGELISNMYGAIEVHKMIKEGRQIRAQEFVKKLKTFFDIEITYESTFSFSRGVIARPHIAMAIQKKYPEYSFDDIFDNFIGDYSKAYVPSTQLPVEQGVALLRRNGAIAVLAHPVLLKDHIRDEVLEMDFDGIEAIYYRNKEGDENRYREYAKEHGIIITAGSDYHGVNNDTKHGMVGDVSLTGEDLKEFLDALQGKVTL